MEKTIALYHGPFLDGTDFPWAQAPRERLRSKFLRQLTQWGRSLFEAGELEAAIVVFEKGLDVDPLAEELYCSLMRCHQALGSRARAIGVYQRCERTLAAIGVPPAPDTVALYQSALK
jgi:two-component SAPR family response regulator